MTKLSGSVHCPSCGHHFTRAIASRTTTDGMRRTRECLRPGTTCPRFCTYEITTSEMGLVREIRRVIREQEGKNPSTPSPSGSEDDQLGLSVPEVRLGQSSAADLRGSSLGEIPEGLRDA